MKKRLALICCIISCILVMAGCSLVKTNEKFDEKTLETNADSFVSSWFEYDFTGMLSTYSGQMDENTAAQYKESGKLREQYGDYDKKTDTSFTITTDTATVNETILTSSGKKLVFSITFDEEGNMSSWKVDEYKSIGQTMSKAGLNTVMSMAIVFLVLIFIAIIIAQFERISDMQSSNKVEPVIIDIPQTPAPAAVIEEDLTDDLELVAVITAAIAAASENECTDGLMIRSIIRRK